MLNDQKGMQPANNRGKPKRGIKGSIPQIGLDIIMVALCNIYSLFRTYAAITDRSDYLKKVKKNKNKIQ